jgi:ribosomal protein S21
MGVKVRVGEHESAGDAYKRLKRLVTFHQRFEKYEQRARWMGEYIRPCDARRSAENRRKKWARVHQLLNEHRPK